MRSKARGKPCRNENLAFITAKAGAEDCGLHLRQRDGACNLESGSPSLCSSGVPHSWRQLASERKERGVWAPGAPCAPGVGAVTRGEQPGDCTVGLLPHGSKHQEWEKLGFLTRIIYLSGKRRVRGAFGGTLGLLRLFHPPETAGGLCRVQGLGSIGIEAVDRQQWPDL